MLLSTGSAQAADPSYYIINCGGGASGSYAADGYASGGTKYTTDQAIDTSGVTDAAPKDVYQSERYGMSFTYTLKSLTAGAYYVVRLHFAEYRYGAKGYGGKPSRQFNVSINGATVLSNFDVYATAGAQYKAVTEIFDTVADSSGKITIVFTGGTDNAEIKAIEAVGPIQITSPNPLGRPDMGDGTNQFVYDATTPNGFLSFPGGVSIPGAVDAETAWLLRDPADSNGPHISLTPDLPAESVSQGGNLYEHTLVPAVPVGSLLFKHGDLSSLVDGFSYSGLPKMDSGLGNHLVTLALDGNISQQAHIQTFFSAKANNYPSAAADYTASSTDPNQRFYTPNWFYYYNQVSKSSGNYEPGDQTQTDSTTPYAVHIKDQTYGDILGIHVYALKPGASMISWAGDIELNGIWLYDDVCAHEKEHQTAFGDGTYAISTDPNDPTKPWVLTSDGDHLDDTWEDNHYFDSTSSNTTGAPAYDNETDAPDDEAIADIVGLGGFLSAFDDWQKDWAGVPSGSTAYIGGVQFGTSHFAIKPGQTRPTPYFMFTPVTQNADESFTKGTPIKIWSKADLTAAVPNLMTSLLAKPARP